MQVCLSPVELLIMQANRFAGQDSAGNLIYRKYNVKRLFI
jgi:hypothetical protein